MNKVYRNVWNEHTQTWVAASELANSHTKSNIVSDLPLCKRLLNKCGLKKIVSFTLTALMLQLHLITPATAANVAITGGLNPSSSAATELYSNGSHGSVVLAGDDDWCGADKVNGRRNIGQTGISAQEEYLRFVQNSSFTGKTVLGGTVTTNPYGTSNGQQNWNGDGVTNGTTSGSSGFMGTPTGGDSNVMPVAYGVYSFATGCGSYATGNYSTAFGNNATATAGGAQAYGVAALASGITSIAMGVGSQATGTSAVALGSLATSDGIGSVAVGLSSVAQKDSATAVGANANATLEKSVALGSDSLANTDAGVVGFDPSGKNTNTTNQSATWKSTAAAVAIGNSTSQITRQINGLAAGTADTDAVNVAQLKNLANYTSDGFTSLSTAINAASDLTPLNNSVSTLSTNVSGLQKDALQWNGSAYDASHGTNAAQQITNVAAGSVTSSSTDAVNGGQLYTLSSSASTSLSSAYNSISTLNTGMTSANTSISTLNTNVSGLQKDALQWNGSAYDASHGTDAAQKITNVAAGSVTSSSTDAVNGGQLYTLSSSASTSLSSAYNSISTLNTGMTSANTSISTLNTNVSGLQKDALQWNGSAYDASHGTNIAQKITNVAAAELVANSTEAVNAGQLYSISSSTSTTLNSLSTTLGKVGDLTNINTNISSITNNISGLKQDALQWNGNAYDASHGTTSAQKITNVAAGSVAFNSTDAINGTQFYTLSTSTSTGISTLSSVLERAGDLSNVNSNIGILSNSVISLGTNLSSANTSISTLNNKITNLQKDALQWNGSSYDASHGSGTAQKITNIAASDLAANSTDAVNAGQLYSISTLTSTTLNSFSTTLSKAGDLSNVNNNINTLNTNVSALQKDALQWNGSAYDASHGSGAPQKITNVAAGSLLAGSTDAVTGSQLSTTNSILTSLSSSANNVSTTVNNLQTDALQWKRYQDGTVGYDASHGVQGARYKITNLANGALNVDSSDAVTGNQLYTTNLSLSTVSDSLNIVTASANKLQNNALQWNDLMSAYDASHNSGAPQRITNVAPGQLAANSYEAVNAGQLYTTNSILSSVSTSNFNNYNNIINISSSLSTLQTSALKWNGAAYDASHDSGTPQKITNVSNGTLGANSTDAVNASQLYTTNATLEKANNSIATFGASLNTLQSSALKWNGIAYDASHDSGSPQRITNIATGILAPNSTDAVNAGQIFQLSSSASTGISSLSTTISTVRNTTSKIDGLADNIDALNKGLSTTNNNLSTLKNNSIQWNTDYGAYDLLRDGKPQRLINVDNGDVSPTSTQAINGSQLYETNTKITTITNSMADLTNSLNNNAIRINSIADSTSRISGSLSTATDKINSLQQNALLINGENYDAKYTKITNLAIGKIDRDSSDAVTGGQLYNTNLSVSSIITSVGNLTGKLNGAINRIDTLSGTTTMLSNNLSTVNTSISTLQENALQWKDGNFTASRGIDGPQKITNLALGDINQNSTDAVNGSQLYSTNSSLSTVSTSVNNLTGALNNTNLQINALSNSTSQIQTNLSSVMNNITDIQKNALQWNNDAYDASHGTGNAQKITMVAAGKETRESTDAVNGGQLFSLSSTVSGNLSTVISRIDNLSQSTTAIVGNLSTANNSITILQKDALQWNGAAYDASHGSSVAQKITKVASGDVSLGSTDAVNGGQLYSLSTTVSNSINNITGGNIGNINNTIDQLSTSLIATQGRIDTISQSTSTIARSLSSAANSIGNLQKDALQWNGSAFDASHGSGNPQKITNVAAGDVTDTSSDAVNGAQLHSLSSSTSSGLGQVNNAVNTLTTSLNTASNRIDTVSQSTTTIAGNLSSAVNSISTLQKNALLWNGTAFDAGHNSGTAQRIINVAAGDINQDSTDAVNGGQLYSLSTSTNTDIDNLAYSFSNSLSTGLGYAKTRIDMISQSTSTIAGNLSTAVSNISTLQKDALQWNGNAYDASHGTDSPQKITKVATGDVNGNSTDAINGSQLYSLSSSFNDSLTSMAAGNSNDLNTTNNNLSKLSSSVSSAANNISILQRDALQWNGAAYDASHGTGNAQRIVNVAAGDISENSTNAVNAGQLYSLSTATISGMDNLSNTLSNTFSTGLSTTNLRIDNVFKSTSTLADNLSTAANNINSLQKDALQWKGNAYDASHGSDSAQRITNVAAGGVGKDSTDAVNGSQLFSLSSSFSESLSSIASGNSTDLTNISNSISSLATGLSTTSNSLSTLQKDALMWNGSGYDASHGSGTAQKILQVASGDVNQNSTDAVNGGQLFSLSTSILSSVSSSVENIASQNKLNLDEVNKKMQTVQGLISTTQENMATASKQIASVSSDLSNTKSELEYVKKHAVMYDDEINSLYSLTRAGNEKTISNVADGTISADSNQAVNGRQLYSLSTSTSTSLSSLQDQLTIATGNVPAGLSTSLETLQKNALQWNGTVYDAGRGSSSGQKITNVAVGDENKDSKDAVNGSQLWKMRNDFKDDIQSLSTAFDQKLTNQGGSGNNAAIAEAANKANKAIADTEKLSTSTADALTAVAASLGGNASYSPVTRAGNGGFNAPSYSTTAADGSTITANNVGDALTNLYNGGSKYAKVNSTLSVASASGTNSVAIGGAATASGNDAIAIGAQASAGTAGGVAIGNHASVTQAGGIALGANSVASTAGGISGYIPVTATGQQARAIMATTSTEAAVSVGDASKGVYRQITGVAAGTADTDAVNVAQLKGVNSQMENINRNLSYVNDRVQHVERRAYSGTALAMALSGAYLPQLNAGEQTVGVGMGSYHGYTAVGINYKATNNTGKFSWGAGVSTTGHETGFNAGVGYKW